MTRPPGSTAELLASARAVIDRARQQRGEHVALMQQVSERVAKVRG